MTPPNRDRHLSKHYATMEALFTALARLHKETILPVGAPPRRYAVKVVVSEQVTPEQEACVDALHSACEVLREHSQVATADFANDAVFHTALTGFDRAYARAARRIAHNCFV